MKSAFFTLFTLAAGVFAGPVPVAPSATREVATAVETKVTLVHLTETIKTYTGAINSTVSNVGSKSLTTTEQTSLVNELLPQFEGISSVLQIAVKSATGSDFTVGLSATSDILEAVEGLVSELLYTVISVIKITGLGDVLLHVLQLIMVSLGSIIRIVTSTLSGLDGLLGAVDSILNLVLSTVSDILGSDSDLLGTVTGLLSLLTSVL